MVKYEILIIVNSIFLFLSRFLCGIIFSYNNHLDGFYWCFIASIFYLSFIIAVFIGRGFHKNFQQKNYFSSNYKKLLNKKHSLRAYLFKRITRINFIKIRHFAWYLFQIEIISTTIYFSLTVGWTWGFDLYIILLTSFFYLNLRKYSPLIFLFPVAYFLIFSTTYFVSNKVTNQDGQLAIYIINAVFAISSIFYSQLILELGRVIKYINDENRKSHLKRLTSFDALTDTYHKYSFLEIMNAKFENNSDEDVITQASTIIIEISNLRKINEEFTTDLGNEVLKEFAYILRKHSENYEKYIARWSGNEFLVFIANEDEVVVKNYIDEIKQDAMKNRFGVKGAKVQVVFGVSHTVSFDYQINKFINEAYEELASNREKLNYEKGDL